MRQPIDLERKIVIDTKTKTILILRENHNVSMRENCNKLIVQNDQIL